MSSDNEIHIILGPDDIYELLKSFSIKQSDQIIKSDQYYHLKISYEGNANEISHYSHMRDDF